MAEEQLLPVTLPLVPGTPKAWLMLLEESGPLLLDCSFTGAGTGIAIVKQVREQRCAVLKVLLYTGLKPTALLILWVKTDHFVSDRLNAEFWWVCCWGFVGFFVVGVSLALVSTVRL